MVTRESGTKLRIKKLIDIQISFSEILKKKEAIFFCMFYNQVQRMVVQFLYDEQRADYSF